MRHGLFCEKRFRCYGTAVKGLAVARIAGVNIPTSKRVPIALTYITGIGQTSAEAICEALQLSSEIRGEIGRNGREFVTARFSLDRMTTETLAIYEKLLDGS